MRSFGSGRVGFWTKHRRASYPCFCWLPLVTSPTRHGHSKSVSTAAKKTTFNGQCLGELLRDHHLQAANTYFPVGSDFLWTLQIDFACLPAAIHVHRCCALHHIGDRLQVAAAPGRRDHRSIQCVFQLELAYGTHERRQDHQWDKNKFTQGALLRSTIFGRNSTKCSWTPALT